MSEAGLGRSTLLESVALYGQLQGHVLVRAQGSENASPFQLLRMIMQSLAALYPGVLEMPSASAFGSVPAQRSSLNAAGFELCPHGAHATRRDLRAYKQICEAWLEHVRGRPESALRLFAPVIETEHAQGIATVVVNCALHAAVLNTLGKHADAIVVCERAIGDPTRLHERTLGMRFLQRERAVALAGAGRFAEAAALAAQQIAEAKPLDNPLELGASHRDRYVDAPS